MVDPGKAPKVANHTHSNNNFHSKQPSILRVGSAVNMQKCITCIQGSFDQQEGFLQEIPRNISQFNNSYLPSKYGIRKFRVCLANFIKILKLGFYGVQGWECSSADSSTHKILGSISSNGYNGVYLSIIPALNGGRGGSEVKGHPQLNIESELSLGFEALSQK